MGTDIVLHKCCICLLYIFMCYYTYNQTPSIELYIYHPFGKFCNKTNIIIYVEEEAIKDHYKVSNKAIIVQRSAKGARRGNLY